MTPSTGFIHSVPISTFRHRISRALFEAILLVSCTAAAGVRSGSDLVYMKNGDKITCEIKSLEQGQLSVKPDYTSSNIVLDWAKVDHIESKQGFVVTDPKGKIYSGTIKLDPESKTLEVSGPVPTNLPNKSVVQIEQLGDSFWKRLRGKVDLGTSFTLSNDQRNISLQGGLYYQSEARYFSLDSNSQYTSQQQTNDTNESNIKTALYQQIATSPWYYGGIGNFLSSTGQQVSLRSTLGMGLAKRMIFTNRTNLSAVGGLAVTVEKDAPNTTSGARTKALDSAFSIQYSTFRFDSTTFDTAVWLYPSITSPGRVRMTINQDIYYKFLGDFYVRLSFYDNYDNQPVIGAPENNLGGSTTLGWSFH
jgi:hypothetical protein